MTNYGIGTFAQGGAEPFPGLVVDDRVLDLRGEFGDAATVLGLLQDWEGSLERLDRLAEAVAGAGGSGGSGEPGGPGGPNARALNEVTVLPPIYPPGAYLLAGANYRMHIIEMRTANAVAAGRDGEEAHRAATQEMDERAAHGIPFMFIGWPGAVIGANDDVMIPGDTGQKHDWELELAVVIGRHARCISADEAMDYVAGYTILNDVSTRDRMHRSDLRFTDFLATKHRPTFKPIGPWITPAKFVADPHNLRVKLSVNGELMQNDTTGDMIFEIPRLIEYASGMTDLRPGDMIATGSPSGNAAQMGGRFLQPGDLMEAEIEGLGTQTNHVVAATLSPQGPDAGSAFKPRDP